MNPVLRAVTLIVACLALSGCIRMIAATSSEPVDRHHGERTLGSGIEDQAIENKTRINLYRASDQLADARIKVVSYNGVVLLAGQVETSELKKQAGNIARRIRHVEQVHNEIGISGSSSFLARANDAWLTSKVKMRLYFNGDTPGGRTKVVTVNGVVYLMGLLTREEAEAVVSSVQNVYGVQKIVKIIEYIQNP
jgi:osmotically-inducible protein OsmY